MKAARVRQRENFGEIYLISADKVDDEEEDDD